MQQNRAVLDHQQFDFVVRMMNCCLQVRQPHSLAEPWAGLSWAGLPGLPMRVRLLAL